MTDALSFIQAQPEPAPAPETPADVAARLTAAGHRLLTVDGRLFTTHASKLTDDDRATLKAHKAAFMALAEQPPSKPVIEFLTARPDTRIDPDWRPDEPPSLDGIDTLIFDTETTGLRWWEQDRPLGLSCRRPDGSSFYLPWGHASGNLDEATVRRWCERELRGKHLVGANIKFDLNMMYAWGIDLEAQGCTAADVQIYAALLDDNRKQFNLNLLANDLLGRAKTGLDLDKSRMASYHASEVAEYAKTDVDLTGELHAVMLPLLAAENLQRVARLEDEVIFPVCHMERNGAPIDRERLDRWVTESGTQLNTMLWELAKATGQQINPDASSDLEKLFHHLGLTVVYLDSGAPSFTDNILKRHTHPLVALVRRITKLSDLRSRYLVKYQKLISSDGMLRYALHQTRYQDDRGLEYGTGPGRFSSSAMIKHEVGDNIQQVMKVGKQRKNNGYGEKDSSHDDEIYIIRKLMVADRRTCPDAQWLAADAMQIEYRMFAEYARSPKVVEAYQKDPLLSFHELTLAMMKSFKPDMLYDEQKTFNFACVTVDTPILTADLRWVPAGDLRVDDRLLAFQESIDESAKVGRSRARRWQLSSVLANPIEKRECAEVILENGDVLTCTLDHPWVTFLNRRMPAARNRPVWVQTKDLAVGDSIARYITPWEEDRSWESGWLAGFFDGEGWASGKSSVVGCNQNAGPLLEFAHDLLSKFTPLVHRQPNCGNSSTEALYVGGVVQEKLRFLGRVRPRRILSTFVDSLHGRMAQVEHRVKVVSIRPIGLQWIAALGTTSRTYIANGYGAHNTIYGAKTIQQAFMLGFITDEEATAMRKAKDYSNPKLARMQDIERAFKKVLPEVEPLLKKSARLAEERGYVVTKLGRRSRFNIDKRYHKALNNVLQGSAADYNKVKLVELHKERKHTGFLMRFTVHDEVDGDAQLPETLSRVREILNHQSWPEMVIPILWDTNVGPTWAEAK